MAGSLFVVATPIGNLEDLTFRALRTLKEVELIAAEDTRRTSKLLAHYGVAKPLVSLHEHNEHREAAGLVARMAAGLTVALVSDAGTPGISDPGATLVRLARAHGIRVVPIPGPSAITAALSVSGITATPFTFLGYPPPGGQARDRWMECLHSQTGAVVFFEAPHRIQRTLDESAVYLVNRQILVNREISKINEQLVSWPIAAVNGAEPMTERGEFVIVVSPPITAELGLELDPEKTFRLFDQLVGSSGLSDENAIVAIGAMKGVSVQKVAKAVKKGAIWVKRQMNAND